MYKLVNRGPLCTEAAVNHDSVVLSVLGIPVLLVHSATHFNIVLALSYPYNVMVLMLELLTKVFLYVCHMHR